MKPIEMGYCFRKNGSIIYKDTCGGPALLDPYRRVLVELNPVAARIWQLLDGEHSVASIAEVLNNEFEADGGRLVKDLTGFLKDLLRREMIE